MAYRNRDTPQRLSNPPKVVKIDFNFGRWIILRGHHYIRESDPKDPKTLDVPKKGLALFVYKHNPNCFCFEENNGE